MHHRHHYSNIPTEIVRSVVVIAETGSFSKAAERLGLSQPAISAQIKRLQLLVGGTIFERTAGGVAFTPKGKLILSHARKLLDANDQILSLGGALSDSQPVRVGITNMLVQPFLEVWQAKPDETQLSFIVDLSTELARFVADGHLNVACIVSPPADLLNPIFEWEEEFVWVRGPNFVLRPGTPIPLIGWTGIVTDQPMIEALENAGLSYRLVFTSADHSARTMAVAAGIGLMGVPRSEAGGNLVIANEYYLPPMRKARIGIFVGPPADQQIVADVVDVFKRLAAQRSGRQRAEANAGATVTTTQAG
jgi:DNA-binding transcriptional LysR family regulator